MAIAELPPPPTGEADFGWLRDLKPEHVERLVALTPPAERAALLEALEALDLERPPWEPMAHQVPPPMTEEWFGWLMMGGRGAGKTAAVAHVMDDHANGPPCLPGRVPHRMGIIAPTLGDASASIVHGDDGLAVINPEVREVTRKGGTVVLWPNGSEAMLFGTNTLKDVDRLRAKGNRCFDLREEVAAWPYLKDGLEQADFGLRKGVARWIGATTPRPRPSIRRLDADPKIRVVTAETDANKHLSAERRAALYEQYGNTRVGLQELKGLILEEVSGALWSQEQIEQFRVSADEVPPLVRVRTYVDPSWGTTNDECGIIVVGVDRKRHAYILEDLSKRTTPSEWGRLAALGRLPSPAELEAVDEETGRPIPPQARMWHGRASEKVVAEGNFQGEQVRLVMKLTSRDLHRRISFGLVHASRGKRLRAEPVQALYEQGRVHHVGQLPGLEFQLTNWIPPEAGEDAGDPGDPAMMEGGEGEPESSKWSPDRLDAMVFGVTDLVLGVGTGTGRMEVADGRLPTVGGSGRTAGPGRIPSATRQAKMYEEQTGKPIG